MSLYTQRHEQLFGKTAGCEKLQSAVDALNDLFKKAKVAHWNVTGANFYQQHQLFEAIAQAAIAQADVVAERMRALDHKVGPELDDDVVDVQKEIDDVVTKLKAAYGEDTETDNMLQEMVTEMEKFRWFLKSSK